ncbi:Zn-dependent hydrolase [Devosia submarina]|uniref:Zn-dependent hydrolase n=1 Tax=Devosia submarina TaxID=1173082 RepID=UPI000D38FAC1|nr:Zn-dependent hydrolase [Devosia submarina]
MPKINADRLLSTLRQFAEFGRYKTGVHRPTYGEDDMASRHWLIQQYKMLGLDAHIDGVGNVFGYPRTSRRSLLIGSHAESQNHAGWLDGAMGVIYGLEVARTFAETNDCQDLPIAPVAWADEESHFIALLGSRSYVGDLDDAELDAAINAYTGQPLREALRKAGLSGTPRTFADPTRHVGYVEAHIEQGDYLESIGKRIGVVTSIVAIWQYRVVISGIQNHAGTTRMAIRRDAGLAAARLAVLIDDRFPEICGERSVWTTGRMTLEPGAPSIIPGRAEVLFQIRDEDEAVLQRMHDRLEQLVEETRMASGCEISLERIAKGQPGRMDAAFQSAIERAAQQHCPGGHVKMPSGASHDAQLVARKMRAGMLFVPSIGGISHHWTENTEDDDLVLGCQVLADAAEDILRNDL